MPKYDYIVERTDNWRQLQQRLDEAGASGYHLHTLIRTSSAQTCQIIMERVTEDA